MPVATCVLDDFALPLYVSGARLISQTDDTRLRDAILLLHLANHRAELQLGVSSVTACPLVGVHEGCDWPRVDACSTTPWARPLDTDDQACTYRYVSHGLQNAQIREHEDR